MKKIFIFVLIFLLLVTTLSASKSNLGTFKKGDNVTLIQTCDNCTYVNITAIRYPNSTAFIENVVMTKDGTKYTYNLINNYTSVIGEYTVTGVGDLDGDTDSWVYTFQINAIGFESTDARSGAADRGVYMIFGLATLLFLGFLFLPQDKTKTDEMGNLIYGGNNRPFKWTFFLLSVLFLSIGLNLTFISIYNDIGDTQIGAVYDQLAAGSLYLFWFSFGLLLFLWVFTTIATLADKKRMKQAEATGSPTTFNYR